MFHVVIRTSIDAALLKKMYQILGANATFSSIIEHSRDNISTSTTPLSTKARDHYADDSTSILQRLAATTTNTWRCPAFH